MIILEFIILIIGLFISLLSLQKQDSKRKNTSKRVLAFFYITLFITSIIVILIKSEDATQSGLKLFNTLHNIEKQSDTLVTLLDSISVLKNRMDIIFTKTEEAIIQREKSQKIFDEQNKLLEKSNQLTQKQIEDSKPEVTVYTEHITFSYIDSLKTQKRIVFTNEGQRIAQKFRSKTLIAFKNRIDSKFFYYHLSFSDDSEIYPSKMLVSTDIIPVNYQEIFEKTNGGVIVISVRYFDELLLNNIDKQLIFRMHIDQDKIKIFQESSVPGALEVYLYENQINMAID